MTVQRRRQATGELRVATMALGAVGLAMLAGVGANPAHAQRIENGKAVFAALDKVTARISKLEIKLGDTIRFGALKVTPRACYSRAPTEPPRTLTFVEVDEIQLDGRENRIFAGWMFAESPGLNAVEHPVFDVWLTDCSEPVRPAAATARGPATPANPTAKGQPAPPPAAAIPEPPPEDQRPRTRPRR